MLARTIFVLLMLINGFEFVNADGDSFGRLENIAFDLQTQIQHLSDQLNAQNIKMQNMEATIGQQNEKIEALNKYCEMKDWLKIKNENDRVENLTLKRDSTPDNLDPSLTSGLHRKKRDLEPRVSRQKRLILGEPTHQEVAFYAYMSSHLASPGHGQQLVFQTAVTNVGNHYNRHSGIFTAPVPGVYVFSWTLAVSEGHYIYTQIFVNSNAVGATYTSAYGVNNVRTTTGLVVVQLNAMDVVSIRVNMNGALDATVYSNDYHKSSFSGWKIN